MHILSLLKKFRVQLLINALFLLIAILYIGKAIDFHFFTHYINGVDTFQWLNFFGYIKGGLFIWDINPAGRLEPMTFTPIIYNVLLQVIYSIVHVKILTINIYWMLSTYLLLLSFFLFYQIFFSPKKALLASFITFINMNLVLTLYYPLIYVNYVGLAGFPLCFFLFFKYLKTNNFVYVLMYAIFNLLLFRALNILLLVNLLVPLLVYCYAIKEISLKDYLKKLFVLGFLTFLVLFPLLLNLGISYKTVVNNKANDSYNQESLKPYYMSNFNLLNTFRLTNSFRIDDVKSPEFPSFVSYSFAKLYRENILYVFVSFIIFVVLLAGLVTGKKNAFKITVLSVLIVLVFLAKSLNPPFVFINQLLYSNTFYLYFFRSGGKYFMPIIIVLLVLLIFLNLKKNKITYGLLILYLLMHAMLIFVLYKPVAKYWNTVLPKQYLSTSQVISQLKDTDRIFLLPVSYSDGGVTIYADGYSGISRLELLNPDRSFINKNFFNTVSEGYTSIINSISQSNRVNYSALDKNANVLGYRYLVLEKDVRYYPDLNLKSQKNFTGDIEKIINPRQWVKVYENSLDVLYKIKDNLFEGKIRATNTAVDFQYVNPTTYKIYVHNLKNKSQLSFVESYSSGWNLYLEKNPSNAWCNKGDYFELSKTKECFGGERTFDLNELTTLYKKSIFDDTHALENSFSNKWQIDPNYVKQHFSADYYKVNSDGGIDLEFTLYFKPQSYYFLGLLISASVILLVIVGLLVVGIKKRKRKKNEK